METPLPVDVKSHSGGFVDKADVNSHSDGFGEKETPLPADSTFNSEGLPSMSDVNGTILNEDVQISLEGFGVIGDIRNEIQALNRKMDKLYVEEKSNSRKLDLIIKLMKGSSETQEFHFETSSSIDEFKKLNEQIESDEFFVSFFVSLV